jgi:hypothetical protein
LRFFFHRLVQWSDLLIQHPQQILAPPTASGQLAQHQLVTVQQQLPQIPHLT